KLLPIKPAHPVTKRLIVSSDRHDTFVVSLSISRYCEKSVFRISFSKGSLASDLSRNHPTITDSLFVNKERGIAQ
ncbi:MAG TPA: hypothetical protein PLF98_10275, partial [Thermotogota bacterium]|nr:hypothetical protein [Thermotogota bacterium]